MYISELILLFSNFEIWRYLSYGQNGRVEIQFDDSAIGSRTSMNIVTPVVRTYCRHDGCCVALLIDDNEPKKLPNLYIVDIMAVV